MVYPWRNTTRSHTITNLVGLDRLRSGRNLSPGLFIWPPCIISPWVYLCIWNHIEFRRNCVYIIVSFFREFREKTSPSLLNLKSPVTSRRNSKILLSKSASPTPRTSSPSVSSLSPKSFYSSPDYNSNLSNDSPSNKKSDGKVIFFIWNIKNNDLLQRCLRLCPQIWVSLVSTSKIYQRTILRCWLLF